MASPHLQKFDAIIIDSDIDTRMRLKQVCASVVNFGKVHPLGSLHEGIGKLKADQRIDVVFISTRIGQENVAGFIKEGKTTPQGQDSAYILVLPMAKSDGASVATSMIGGADGMLFEPYSVDQLVEISLLAAKVRKERSGAREEAALKFLLADIMHQIDLIAYSKSCGYETGQAMKHFKQVCSVLTTLEGESKIRYYGLMVDAFEAAPMAQGLYDRKKYGGASSRVKKKMAEKLAAEVEKLGNSPKSSDTV